MSLANENDIIIPNTTGVIKALACEANLRSNFSTIYRRGKRSR